MKTNANHPIAHLRGIEGRTMYDDTIHKSWIEQSSPPLIGLTKREHFAAMALQGFSVGGIRPGFEKTIAEKAVAVADALVEALNKE